jgi:ubiquinone/menaquinone biosynthesis C-methylase UbiE
LITTHQQLSTDNVFAGILGQEYHSLIEICPLAAKMSQLVGNAVAEYSRHPFGNLQIVELGGGTGITTLAILLATQQATILSIDNAPAMQNQAKLRLQIWIEQQRLAFVMNDALSALKQIATASIDIIATAYTLHNFELNYRAQVIKEIFRVLKSGGQFINGDRYALNDSAAHTTCVQQELAGYFKVFIAQQRLDLLEQWTLHLFADESAHHLMREQVALEELKQVGFSAIQLSHREQVNALVSAIKP